MEVASRPVYDERALFEDDADEDEIVLGRDDELQGQKETSKQRLLSMAKGKPAFEGLRVTSAGHKIQDIRETMTVPVSTDRFPKASEPQFGLGHCHSRSKEKSSCYQGFQCQPICRAELNGSYARLDSNNTILFSMPFYSSTVVAH